jgi:hypothetical protein
MASPGTLFLFVVLAKTLHHTVATEPFDHWICMYNSTDTFAVGSFHAVYSRKRLFWKAISLHFRSAGCSVVPKFARVFCSNRQIKSGRCGLRVWRLQRNTLISWSWRSRLELESQQFVTFETLQKFVSFGRCIDRQARSNDYGRRLQKTSGRTARALEPSVMFQSGFASSNLIFHCFPHLLPFVATLKRTIGCTPPDYTMSFSSSARTLGKVPYHAASQCGLWVHFRQHLGPLHYSAQMINWHKVPIWRTACKSQIVQFVSF